jgi:hypothetical protein
MPSPVFNAEQQALLKSWSETFPGRGWRQLLGMKELWALLRNLTPRPFQS